MINLALVGFGRYGTKLLDSVRDKSTKCRFTGVVSRSPDQVAEKARARGLKVFGSLDDAFADKGIDGFVVVTPHTTHVDFVVACANAGRPVFVEKPFALTRESAARAIAAVKAAGTVVAVGQDRRFLPAMKRLKELIDTGEVGQLLHLDLLYASEAALNYTADRWRVSPAESPVGGLAGSGIHMIDSLIYLAGPIASVYACTTRHSIATPINHTTLALFELKSGVTASLTNVVATAAGFGIHVHGPDARIELRGHDRLEGVPRKGATWSQDFPPFSTQRFEIEAFADAIAGRAPFPISTDEIMNGMATFDAVQRSVELDRRVQVE